jgi:hypothetical protein
MNEPRIRIELRASAHNMLPEVLANIADEHSGPTIGATRARWQAAEAARGAVVLIRTVELPAVPRVGEEMYVAPYTEPAIVDTVSWRTDPGDDEDPHVLVDLEAFDLDVLADDDEDAIRMFVEAGWRVEDWTGAPVEVADGLRSVDSS